MNPVCNDDSHLNRDIDVYLAFVAFRLRGGEPRQTSRNVGGDGEIFRLQSGGRECIQFQS